MKNKKIIFIPGWLDQGVNFPQYETLEIWKKNIKPGKTKLDCDVIIAHSLGCHFVLADWENCKDKKIIFVNPLISNRNIFSWFWRWLKFRWSEERIKGHKNITSPLKILRGIYYYFKFLAPDMFSILDKEDEKDIVIMKGKKDYYFCDDHACRLAKDKNIDVIEIDETGHLWNKSIDEEIEKILGK